MSHSRFLFLVESLRDFVQLCQTRLTDRSNNHSIEYSEKECLRIWQELQVCYECVIAEVEEVLSETQTDVELSDVKLQYSECRELYFSFHERIGDLIQNNIPRCSTFSNPTVDTALVSSNPALAVPPCDTEIFYGDYVSWPEFRDMFTAIYQNNNSLSGVQKMFYLSQKTRGEANKIVRKFPLTNEGFQLAWSRLSRQYENKRVLVNTYLKTLFSIEKLNTESGRALKKLQSDFADSLSCIEALGVKVDEWDAIVVYLCATKLPSASLSQWEQRIADSNEIPRWKDMNKFLTSRYRAMESCAIYDLRGSSASRSTHSSEPRRVSSNQITVNKEKCKVCTGTNHGLIKCAKFKEMTIEARIGAVKKIGVCWNCLAGSHFVKDCPSKHTCDKCRRRHHTLLHKNSSPNGAAGSTTESGSEEPQASTFQIQSNFVTKGSRVLLGTAMVAIKVMDDWFGARALLDSGSEGTFISERLLNRLKLPTSKISAQVTCLNDSTAGMAHKICSLEIGSRRVSNWSVTTQAYVMPKLTNRLPPQNLNLASVDVPTDLVLADPNFHKSDHIDILIGGDIYPRVLLGGVRHEVSGSLLAQETVFGWVLTGPVPVTASRESDVHTYFTELTLDQQIERFWMVEELPNSRCKSAEDDYCEKLFRETTKRRPDGRYVVSLPFKTVAQEDRPLEHSRRGAVSLFLRNEKNLLKNIDFKKVYDEVLEEYLRLGHMKPVDQPLVDDPASYYYMPHHAVIKPDSTTTKVRVVFNASFPTSSGKSLNNILHQGPTLQKDLMLLILQWRFFRYVFNGDIEKMYRQILVNTTDANYQRIVFRSDATSEIRDYRLDTVTFGVNCAPYLAIRTLLRLADDEEQRYPLAASVLRNCMYVDDALVGTHDVTSAIKVRKELMEILKSAGFIIRKWTSNKKEILHGVAKEDLLNSEFLELDESSSTKTLGIKWNAKTDTFSFSNQAFDTDKRVSKRDILSAIAKLFDPAGWLGPTMIIAKLIMQDLWLKKLGWDDEVTGELRAGWIAFLEGLESINAIRVPRWVNYKPFTTVQFHGFCDASEKAYAAALYVRVNDNGWVRTSLVAGKTRVAPIKTISLPRLELCGAVLLAETVSALVPHFPVESYELFLWTDSTIVLSWLKKPACMWNTFVGNRISKIDSRVGTKKWSHVRSEDNPADLGTRGMMPNELKDKALWWEGPRWLQKGIEHWPKLLDQELKTELEVKTVRCNLCLHDDWEDILARFSCYSKAINVISWMFRMLRPLKRLDMPCDSDRISRQEIQNVETKLIIVSQRFHFKQEYSDLMNKKELDKKSKILTLNPFIDDKGIMRVGSRLAKCSSLSYDERFPIILGYGSRFAFLYVSFVHQVTLHGNCSLMLRMVRMRFWIVRAKNLVRKIVQNCVKCVRFRKQVSSQIMGALPEARTTLTRPFAHTGLDFAGPFDIKFIKGRSIYTIKGYVCVFVCFATKAIHLEAVSDLSAAAFLACFSRFVARRSCPSDVYSDNGTNFVAGNKELSSDFNRVLNAAKQDFGSTGFQKVQWHFIPAGAPHMGGLWEAGVKSFKNHFKKVVGTQAYTFEEFGTLLARIEACLNSRPICPMSNNPDDLTPLTPGHFLIGAPLLSNPEPTLPECSLSVMNRWEKLQAMHQQFCRRWKNEYLHEMHKRYKWKYPERDIEIGDLVIIKEDNLAPTVWKLGRVTKTFNGEDNRVRVAELKTQKGVLTRPITKLVLLPIPEEHH